MLKTKDSSQAFNWKQSKAEALRFSPVPSEAAWTGEVKKFAIYSAGVPALTVGQQILPHHCPSSKAVVGLLHFTPNGHLIFGLKASKAICYQWLKEDSIACWWETTKCSGSWENSVSWGQLPSEVKEATVRLGEPTADKQQEGREESNPPMPTLLLRAAGRACEERDRNNWV